MQTEISRLEQAVREAGDAVIRIAKDGFETAALNRAVFRAHYAAENKTRV